MNKISVIFYLFFSMVVVCALQWAGCAEITVGKSTLSNLKGGTHMGTLDIVMIGDSIAMGVVGSGNAPIDFYVANHYPEGLIYINQGIGGNTFADVAARFDNDAANLKPRVIFVHCGTNDIAHGRTWAQIENDLNTINQKCLNAGIPVCFSEILPRNETNQHDATVAQYNMNLASWCAANNRTLLQCHDAMQDPQNPPRPKADYFVDYLHPNVLGNSILADAYFVSFQYHKE